MGVKVAVIVVMAISVLGTGMMIYQASNPQKTCRNSCYDTYRSNLIKVKNYCDAQADQPFGDFNCEVQQGTAEGLLTDCYESCTRLP